MQFEEVLFDHFLLMLLLENATLQWGSDFGKGFCTSTRAEICMYVLVQNLTKLDI